MNEKNELMIQRLVDGELDRQQIRILLHQAESEPELYRRIALSMVEDQVFRSRICELDRQQSVVAAGVKKDDNEKSGSNQAAYFWRGRFPVFLATAAALLVMTAIGYELGQHRLSSTGSENSIASGRDGMTTLAQAPYRLRTVDNNGQEIPLMPISMAQENDWEIKPESIEPSIQQAFRKKGYQVTPEIRFFQGALPDGRQIIVPAHSRRISTWGQ